MAIPVDLADQDTLIRAASTSLNSKVVAQHASMLAPLAVDAVLSIANKSLDSADLRNVRTVKKLNGTIDDTELVNGLLLNQPADVSASGPTRIEKAKIALIQFQLSPPKTDMENSVVVQDYAAMDRILKEERTYLLQLIKKVKVRCGCAKVSPGCLVGPTFGAEADRVPRRTRCPSTRYTLIVVVRRPEPMYSSFKSPFFAMP